MFITDLAAWCNISFGDRYCNPLNYTENFVLNGSVLKDELVIPDGVSVVSDYAFYGFNAISDVTFGKDVTIIGAEAFSDCENLVDAKFPEGLTEIHYRAFYACDLLNNINIPNSVIFIEEMAIDGTAYYDNDANWEHWITTIKSTYVSPGNHTPRAPFSLSSTLLLFTGGRKLHFLQDMTSFLKLECNILTKFNDLTSIPRY